MKKGFTLVELMAVIIILGIIGFISVPAFINSIKSNNIDSYNSIIKDIVLSAETYASNANGNLVQISVKALQDVGYLRKNIINPVTDEMMNGCVYKVSGKTIYREESCSTYIEGLGPDNVCNYPIGSIWNYEYDPEKPYYTFNTPCSGTYKVELWGAEGGGTSTKPGGQGGYTKGNIGLNRNINLYIYVGGEGSANPTQTNIGGYNGGGYSGNNSASNSYGGGGSTDIRLENGLWNNFDSLKSRIMVAAGGGGNIGTTSFNLTPGAGGGLIGISAVGRGDPHYQIPEGATQIGPGVAYNIFKTGSFGYANQDISNGYGGGGGSGYFGGAAGSGHAGAGGSSFISGHAGSIAITSDSTSENINQRTSNGTVCSPGTTDIVCSYHYSDYIFTDTEMIDGEGYNWTTGKGEYVGQTNPDSTKGVGHTGSGYARVTLVSTIAPTSNDITVRFDANGGVVNTTSKKVKLGGTYGNLPVPTREGYVFKGWNGKNKFNISEHITKFNGCTVSNNSIIVSKTNYQASCYGPYINLTSGNTYTTSATISDSFTGRIYAFLNGTSAYSSSIDGNKLTVTNTFNSVQDKNRFNLRQNTTNESTNIVLTTNTLTISNIQLEEGTEATAYEPYYITSSTPVVQTNNHTLTAIWEPLCNTDSTLKECLIINDNKTSYNNSINLIKSRTPNFDETVKNIDDSGLFVSDDDYTTNDETKTYYYRGVVDNNWVKFGDYLWRIIRINGDGSIRMMYSGLASSATHTASNANINKVNYRYGVYETYTKNTTDLYDSSKTVATTYTNGRFGNTYVGYMYNPSRIFMTYPNKEVSTSYKLSLFPTFTNIGASTQYYFFDSFNPTTDCDQSTSDDTGACTLKCRKKGVDGDTGVNCVKSTWPDLANAHTSTTGDGTTSTEYLYTSPYKYTCWDYATAKEVNNADGTTSVYVSCPIVSEILGTVKDQPTYANVKYHGLFSRDAETSNQNIKDSNAKKEVENWYATNILGKTDSNNVLLENYLQDSIFCNERVNTDLNAEWPFNINENFYYTYTRVASQRKPTFKCLNADGTFNTNDSFTLKTTGTDSTVTASGKGNNMLKYPVGLITWDETAFAGGREGSSYTNDVYWLYTGAHYWTMSSSFFSVRIGRAYVGRVNSTGYLNSTNTASALGLRPVINLKAGVKYLSGNGTETSPYEVKLSN